MKLTKFDIGAEIISILTKGMYPDPKDALREYIQNGVDAGATKMSIKVRQESVIVEDNGIGMNHKILRKAVRVGVSDKNPTKNVGFMGIGIYSAFHLCHKLTIYSKGSEGIANQLVMDFGEMKSILDEQKVLRINGNIESDELIDLQTILEKCIHLSEDDSLGSTIFPESGTRIEMEGIEPEFYTALSDFDEVSDYLRNVIPLTFDAQNFEHAAEIQIYITDICNSHNQKFELIDLELQVNSRIESLFRPYRNSDFNKDNIPLKPIFYPIEVEGEFFGVAWGCLNGVRKKLDNKSLRGFILKKQGFSIGKRETLVKYFPRGNTFFDRYSGEVIIVNPKILPNASRNDLEYSSLRSRFYDAFTDVAQNYDEHANLFQERSKADEELSNLHTGIAKELASYNEYEEDAETLVSKIVALKKIFEKLDGRLDRKGYSQESEVKAISLRDQVKSFEEVVQQRIKTLTEQKQKAKQNTTTKLDLAKNVAKIEVGKLPAEKKYESLNELLEDLEYKIDPDLYQLMDLIDELFVQNSSRNKAHYYELLITLKERIQNS